MVHGGLVVPHRISIGRAAVGGETVGENSNSGVTKKGQPSTTWIKRGRKQEANIVAEGYETQWPEPVHEEGAFLTHFR